MLTGRILEMENLNDIKIAFNSNLFVHTTTQIVGHYYKDFVEINEEFERMTEDEYAKMMISKANACKDKKERDKIANEYAENMQKYYPFRKNYRTLSFTDNVSALNGYILFKIDTVDQQFDLSLLDFISYDFNNLNDYYLFFINNFNYFVQKLDKEDLKNFKFYTLYKIKDIVHLSQKYYDKEISNIKEYQKIFRECINFCYQINSNINLSNLTLQQRFFLYNQIYKNPFKDISNKFEIINLLDYTYDDIPYNSDAVTPNDVYIISSIIHAMDPEGKGLSSTFKFKTNNIFTAFYISLFNIIGMNELYVKICGNCNKYFITPKLNIVYCDRIWTNDLTCKDVGSKLAQKRKESEDNIYKKYRNESSRKSMFASRNNDVPEYQNKYNKWKEQASKFWNDVKKGNKTPEEFEKWIDKNK